MATISPLTEGIQLSPIRKRRSRISYSPVKTPKAAPILERAKSMVFPRSTETPTAQYDLPTAALEFEEFSFWGNDRSLSLSNVSAEHRKALHAYLSRKYGAIDFRYCEPFLVIGCEGGPPSEDERPFSVAGLVSIWRNADDMYFRGRIGYGGEGDPIEIDSGMLAKIVPLEIPPREVVLYLADYVFPDCEALTILWDMLVVELPKASKEAFINRLQSKPDRIDQCLVNVRYYNGPLPNTERRRRVFPPSPQDIKGDCDETDYMRSDKKFYPGTMINSVNKEGEILSSATAGVLVEKGRKKRLTCSFHNWQNHYEKYPENFAQIDPTSQRIFQITQGTPGTAVGFVRERMGNTDIALAQLDKGVVFENSFMEMEYAAKTFIHSDDQRLGDEYIIDSFTTGKQRLLGAGKRFQIQRKTGQPHYHLTVAKDNEHALPPDEVAYIELEQGACVTNEQMMQSKPYIREGSCGAVLLRCHDITSREAPKTVMNRGEICGMMHFANLQARNTAEADNYIIYADAFDPLIEDGWKIIMVPEDAQSSDDLEESPAKKQKTGKSPANHGSPKAGGKKGGRWRGG